VGVEIGVYEGDHALNILTHLNIKRLYLIDPYKGYEEYAHDGIGKDVKDWDSLYNRVLRKLKPYGNKSLLIRKTSDEALADIPDNLDFVYIDGNHSYEFVKADITNYYPKIKKGGVIGGHDFVPGTFGVYQAVAEFEKTHNLKLQGESADWWFVKPCTGCNHNNQKPF
jgi:hypothetical protein